MKRAEWKFPSPPRGEDDFRAYYLHERARKIALAATMGKGSLHDPELVAEKAWIEFHPHWVDCPNPAGYLWKCVRSAVMDELRALKDAPVVVSIDDNQVALSAPLPSRQPSMAQPWEHLSSDPELDAAMNALSDDDRDVLLLAFEFPRGTRSDAEIAEILELPTRRAATMRRRRATARLEVILEDRRYLEHSHRPWALGLRERPMP